MQSGETTAMKGNVVKNRWRMNPLQTVAYIYYVGDELNLSQEFEDTGLLCPRVSAG